MDILTTILGIIDDTLPSISSLMVNFQKNITKSKYITAENIILGIKLFLYSITFIQMAYLYFYKNEKTFTSSTLLKLLITSLNMLIILFIILDIKRFIIKENENENK